MIPDSSLDSKQNQNIFSDIPCDHVSRQSGILSVNVIQAFIKVVECFSIAASAIGKLFVFAKLIQKAFCQFLYSLLEGIEKLLISKVACHSSFFKAVRNKRFRDLIRRGDAVTVGQAEITVTGISRQLAMDFQYLPASENELFKFASMEQLRGWDSQLGRQFENLVLNHVGDIFRFLGVERSLVLSAAPYVQNGTKRGEGCQIDLLVQTRRTLYAVEIKRRREIGAEVMDEMRRKVEGLKVAHGISVRTALVP